MEEIVTLVAHFVFFCICFLAVWRHQ